MLLIMSDTVYCNKWVDVLDTDTGRIGRMDIRRCGAVNCSINGGLSLLKFSFSCRARELCYSYELSEIYVSGYMYFLQGYAIRSFYLYLDGDLYLSLSDIRTGFYVGSVKLAGGKAVTDTAFSNGLDFIEAVPMTFNDFARRAVAH